MRNVVIAALVFCAASAVGSECPVHWSYGDANDWPDACKTGLAQSPVDLTVHAAAAGAAIEFHYDNIAAPEVQNSSYSYKVTNTKGYVRFEGVDYPLLELHFHVPGEHTIGGAPAPMEMHLVHGRNGKPELVIGVLYKDGASVAALNEIVSVLPAKACDHATAKQLNPATLLPKDATKYYRYRGSLTTPGCGEGLTWIVLADRANSTVAQRDAIKKNIGPNARQARAAAPAQKLTLVTAR
jgi:carbonic anhydrase